MLSPPKSGGEEVYARPGKIENREIKSFTAKDSFQYPLEGYAKESVLKNQGCEGNAK
jgi:hypothetical protein